MVGEKQCSRCLAVCPMQANFCARCGQPLEAPAGLRRMNRRGGFGWLICLIAFVAFLRFYSTPPIVEWRPHPLILPSPPRVVDQNFFQPVRPPPNPPPPPDNYGSGDR